MPLPALCAVCGTMPRELRRLQLLVVAILFTVSVLQSVEAASSFTISADEYACYGNIICLGDAHIYDFSHTSNGDMNGNSSLSGSTNTFPGTLSLAHVDVHETGSAGIAYYYEPIRLLDPGTRRTASFNTTFQFFETPYFGSGSKGVGDGMVFVISSDNATVGSLGYSFGVFGDNGIELHKKLVIEFDSVQNAYGLANDIDGNHVGIEINNISSIAHRGALKAGIKLSDRTVVFAWVEYSAESQSLEVRISKQNSRPPDIFLNCTVDLTAVFEEYMWVGFAASNGFGYSSYYVGDWSFESYGIRASHEPLKKKSARLRFKTEIFVFAAGFAAALLLLMALKFYQKRRVPRPGLPAPPSELRPVIYANIPHDIHLAQNGSHLAQDGFRFTCEELSEATGGFADGAKLGEGGFGSMYRGNFPVAVKRIKTESSSGSQQGEKEFRAEVSKIIDLRHKNLIRLLGWCIDEDGRYNIVYDLMPNGALDEVILKSTQDGSTEFPWPKRWKAIKEIASAIKYLHHVCDPQIIHRDIRSSNIMFDDQWNAKLGNFGLASLTNHEQALNSANRWGMRGYIAPEAGPGRFTEKSDIYAFGAVVLEVACGRTVLNQFKENRELVDWVRQQSSKGDLLSVVDKRLLGKYNKEQMAALLQLGLICSDPDPAVRPTALDVEQYLNGMRKVPPVPRAKSAPTYEARPSSSREHVDEAASLLGQ